MEYLEKYEEKWVIWTQKSHSVANFILNSSIRSVLTFERLDIPIF